MGEAVSVSFE